MAKLVKKEGGVRLPGNAQREPTTPRRNKIEKKDHEKIVEKPKKPIEPETGSGHSCCGKKSCSGCGKPRIVGIDRLYPLIK